MPNSREHSHSLLPLHWSLFGKHVSPAIFILPFPLLFRATCYYYRKAYYRAFFWDPAGCAIPEKAKRPGYTGERYYEADLHRLKGELLLQQAVPDAPQAEACLQQALAVARRQQAKSWELRTAMSLARLWQQQGKRATARQLLAEVYGWFIEGFDIPDLQEARALLDVLV